MIRLNYLIDIYCSEEQQEYIRAMLKDIEWAKEEKIEECLLTAIYALETYIKIQLKHDKLKGVEGTEILEIIESWK